MPKELNLKNIFIFLSSILESYKAIIMYYNNGLDHFSNGLIDDAYQMYTNLAAIMHRKERTANNEGKENNSPGCRYEMA